MIIICVCVYSHANVHEVDTIILNLIHTAMIDLPKASWKDMPVHNYYDLVFVKLKIVCCQTGKFFITSRSYRSGR